MIKVMFRATIMWFGLFILVFLNGALREFGFRKFFEELAAHQLSCLSGVILWTTFVWLLWSKIKIKTNKEAIVVGLYWFSLTALTETFLMNRKMTWEQILETYNIASGQFWGLVLLWIAFLPFAVKKFKEGCVT